MKREELVEAHRKVREERAHHTLKSWNNALAMLEDKLLAQAAKARKVPGKPSEHWRVALKEIAEELGVSQYEITYRRAIFMGGAPAAVLWEKVDLGLQVGKAVAILREAQSRVKSGDDVPLRERILELVDTYGNRHNWRAFVGSKKREKLKEPTETPAVPKITAASAAKPFWRELKQSLLNYLELVLTEVDEDDRERYAVDCERELQMVIERHRERWAKAARVAHTQKRVSRQRFINALRTLHMDPPERGAPLEAVLVPARRQQRKLGSLYHPDAHGGAEHMRPQYQAVMEAYSTIEQYVSENTPTRNTLRVVQGGKSK